MWASLRNNQHSVECPAGGIARANRSGRRHHTFEQAALGGVGSCAVPDRGVVSSCKGTFAVDLDNRYGVERLEVRLSGARSS